MLFCVVCCFVVFFFFFFNDTATTEIYTLSLHDALPISYENKITSSNYKTMSSSELSVEVQASYSGLFSVGGGFGLSS